MELVSTALMPQHNADLFKMSQASIQIAGIQTIKAKHSNLVKKEIELFGEVMKDQSRVYKQIAHLPGQIEKCMSTKSVNKLEKGKKSPGYIPKK